MWIRNQNKKDMIDITGKRLFLWWSSQWNIYVDPMTTAEDVSVSLGEYETEERALEVLDEIQNHIHEFIVNSQMSSDLQKEGLAHDVPTIYQMPEK